MNLENSAKNKMYSVVKVVGSVVWLQPHHRTNHDDVF